MTRATAPARQQLRDALGAATYDTAIVGGGIYGAMLALVGAARGQRVVLLERGDFGGGVTFNSLRTIHGGLRYLQFLDLQRALVSNAQRRWWLSRFPDLVHPVSCLMPLYGEGLRRPATLRAALLLARALRLGRDADGRPGRAEVVAPPAVLQEVPLCRQAGLKGGAVWQDAFMPRSHRVLIECLRWATAHGATVANYTTLVAGARTSGDTGTWQLTVRDGLSNESVQVRARRVINAAGAAVDDVAAKLTDGRATPMLIPTLTWNLLLDRPPVAACSVAVKPPGQGRRTYFVHPFHGYALVGTGHVGVAGPVSAVDGVATTDLQAMLLDLNEALPGFSLTTDDIKHLFWGVLPGVEPGSDAMLMRPRIVDHGATDGAAGAWSVMGVKFTEAPFVAGSVWDRILGRTRESLADRPACQPVPTVAEARDLPDSALAQCITELLEREWCASLDDVLWRRTDFWLDEALCARVRALIDDDVRGVG